MPSTTSPRWKSAGRSPSCMTTRSAGRAGDTSDNQGSESPKVADYGRGSAPLPVSCPSGASACVGSTVICRATDAIRVSRFHSPRILGQLGDRILGLYIAACARCS